MIRNVDWRCTVCFHEEMNILSAETETRICSCGRPMEQVWWKRPSRNAQWSDKDAVMVHVNPVTGDVRYPGQHSATLKEGYERVYLRSLPDVNRFEKDHRVAVHAMHYDSNGTAIDDYVQGRKETH